MKNDFLLDGMRQLACIKQDERIGNSETSPA
jgi:hypothetical protein